MIKKVVSCQLSVASVLFLLSVAYAQPIFSTALIKNAKQYDGKIVVYAGEVIGDIMVRGEFAWINVNDNKNAIGIWAAKELTKTISNTGSYKSKGDEIEITGIFHRTCVEHGGDLDIHAQTIRKIGSGGVTEEIISVRKRNLVFLLLGLLCLALILKQSKSK